MKDNNYVSIIQEIKNANALLREKKYEEAFDSYKKINRESIASSYVIDFYEKILRKKIEKNKNNEYVLNQNHSTENKRYNDDFLFKNKNDLLINDINIIHNELETIYLKLIDSDKRYLDIQKILRILLQNYPDLIIYRAAQFEEVDSVGLLQWTFSDLISETIAIKNIIFETKIESDNLIINIITIELYEKNPLKLPNRNVLPNINMIQTKSENLERQKVNNEILLKNIVLILKILLKTWDLPKSFSIRKVDFINYLENKVKISNIEFKN